MKPIYLLLLLTMTACATPSQVNETYRSDSLDGTAFDKVLIVGIAGSANTRRLFEDALAARKAELLKKWEQAAIRTKLRELEYSLKMQRKRVELLLMQAQAA